MEPETRKRMVFYRDVEMTADWPEKIRQAQSLATYTIEGRQYPRVRYGRERPSWHADKRACHDCAVVEGELHVPGCDVEQCPACGIQAISCCCEIEGLPDGARPD